VGIDLYEPRLEQARALAAERGVDNLSFQVTGVYELPFGDNTFDAAFENVARPLAPLIFANCLLRNVKKQDLTHSCEAPVARRLSRVEIMPD